MKNEEFKAGFMKDKQEDLAFLKQIDYDSIKSKVESAIHSGNTARMLETKVQIASSYDSGVRKDRKSQISVPFIDEEIAGFVRKYLDITNPLDQEIKKRAKKSETIFREAYSSPAPDIATLRQSSEEYSVFQGKAEGLDEAILKYSGFSKELRKVEQQVDDCVQEYRSINSAGMLKKIKQDAGFLKKTIAEITQKHAIPGNAAYNYRNKNLEKIEAELERFAKDDFAEKRKNAEHEMKITGDFIELLACAAGKEKYAVLEEISRQKFSDYKPFEATVYLGDSAKDHSALVRELSSDAADCALRYQADEVQKLNKTVADTLANSRNIDELKAQKIRISNEYSGKADVLRQLSGQDALKQALISGTASIDGLVKEKNDAAERERQQELAKKKIQVESEERLKRDENEKKYNLSKKEEENRALTGRVEGLEKDKKYLESENRKQEETISTLKESMSKLAPLIHDGHNASQAQQSQINKQLSSMETALQSANLPKLYQEVQDLRKLFDQRYAQGTDQTKVKSMIDSAVKTIDDKLNKMYEQMQQKKDSPAAATESSIKAIDSKLSSIYEQVQKKDQPSAALIDNAMKTIDGKLDKIYSQMQKKEEQAARKDSPQSEMTSKCAMAEQMGALNATRRLPYAANIPKEAAEPKRLSYTVPANPTNEEMRPKAIENSQPQIHIGTYIGTMNANNVSFGQAAPAVQRQEAGTFDLAYELQGRHLPKNTALNNVVRRITGNENMNMAERLLSIEDYICQDTPAVNDHKDLGWLKWFREKCVDEINFGIVGDFIRNHGFVKEQFYGVIKNVIDPYIAKCEKALSAVSIH